VYPDGSIHTARHQQLSITGETEAGAGERLAVQLVVKLWGRGKGILTYL